MPRSASVIIKRDSFFELQRETKWYHYISGQLLLQSRATIISNAVQKANERNRRNRFWQPTSSFNPNLPGDRHFTTIGI